MSRNPADPLAKKGWMRDVAEEQNVGDDFEGESERERRVGRDREVVVDIFKRNRGVNRGTYFLRVSLRSSVRQDIIHRYQIDIDRYSSEAEFLQAVYVGAGALAENDNEKYAGNWDPEYVAKQAKDAAYELLHEID